MKSIICSILTGLVLVFILSITDAFTDPITQNEINRRVHVKGGMGDNITLTSNSSIGLGSFSFVLSGETNDGTPLAIKATSSEYSMVYTQEYKCYELMNATTDKVCENYGIPFIYHSGDFLKYKTMAMTMLNLDLYSLHRELGGFSKESILIIFRDMIKTLKFMHSKGVIHKDIHLSNIMTKGASIFLMDLNLCTEKGLNNEGVNELFVEDYDMRKLFTTMSKLMGVQMYCYAEEMLGINEQKREMKEEFLLKRVKYTELIEPYVEFCIDTIEAMKEKRLPKYDYLYKLFDDILYTGRNRSERILFEWLTPEEQVAAMAENISSIESIVFPE